MFDNEKIAFEGMVGDAMGVSVNGKPVTDMWWNLLRSFDFNAIKLALKKHAIRNKFAPAPSQIIQIIYNFMPGEEAWNHFPKFEHQGAVVTDEMRKAFGAASDSVQRGDLVAGRMAFLEAYESAMADSIVEGKAPIYSYSAPSEGDPDQKRLEKQRAIRAAEGKGLISSERARKELRIENFPEPTFGLIESQLKKQALLEGDVKPENVTDDGQKSGLEKFRELRAELKKKTKKITEEEDEDDCE